MGDQEKGRSPKKLKSLMDVPNVAHLKIQVVSFDMNLISSTKRIPRPSYPFGGKLGRSGKGWSTEEAKIIDGSSVCSAPESTGSNLQYEQCLFSVRCSFTKLSISVKNLGYQVKGPLTIKQKLLIEVPYALK